MDKTKLTSRWAIIGYALIAIGLVATILTLKIPDINKTWGDLLLLAKTLGLIGVILLQFILTIAFNYFGFERSRFMGLMIGINFALLFIIVDVNLLLLEPLEYAALDFRFRLSAGEISEIPVEDGAVFERTNPKAHKAIKIIGIQTETVEAFGGFPFSWKYYAAYLKALEKSNLNTIMFDVFFLDAPKNSFELNGKKMTLGEAIRRNNKVIIDYGFETDSSKLREFRKRRNENKDMQARLAELERFRIPDMNVIDNAYLQGPEWVAFPDVPLAEIVRAVHGLGGANVKYTEGGKNYKMPMVFKWENKIYPSISLIMACRYYGIDVTKDVKVKLGDYVLLQNIPEKKMKFMSDEEVDIMTKPTSDRSLRIPIDHEGLMDINFIGGPFSFPSIPLHTIVEDDREEPGIYSEQLNPFVFKDMILLTAMYYATGVAKDIHPGPFGNVAGIEHHANALNTILQQDFLYHVPAWVNYLIFILVGLLVGWLVPRYNTMLVLLSITGFAILFIVEVFFVFNVFNLVHTFFTPFIEMTLVLITIVAYKSFTEEENVKYIRNTFSKFVSKDVVNTLLANPDMLKLGGEKKEITVFFSDVRGFTSISESLSPEDLVQLLNDYLSVMTDLIIEYRGTIDKYMGDAIMAFWGAPVPEKDHAYLACVATLKQVKELKNLQDKWQAQGWPVIDVGAGLNTGYAVVGNMGSSHRMDYTVMGDTVNLGSRLEGTNKMYHTRIIISQYTYEKVKDRVIARELDNIRVKGKQEPVTIYELIELVDEADYERLRVKTT